MSAVNMKVQLTKNEDGTFLFQVFFDDKQEDSFTVMLPNAIVSVVYFNGLISSAKSAEMIMSLVDEDSAIALMELISASFIFAIQEAKKN